MRAETIIINKERNATLTAYIQIVGGEFHYAKKRPAIIVLPGGGYGFCSDREADPVAFAYLKAGYHVFILRYSTAEHRQWPNPLDDYEASMELIKSRSEEWGIYPDKIAVVGFSAGGHLAAVAATVSKNRPAAAIIGYAALDKKVRDICKINATVPIEEVDDKTCPCFLFASREDWLLPVKQQVEFEMALVKNKISFESHIYAYGGHGFSTAESYLAPGKICSRAKNWVQDSIEWLKDVLGDFDKEGMTKPVCKPRINDDDQEYLSLDCTCGHLKRQGEEVKEILKPFFTRLEEALKPFKDKGIDLSWEEIRASNLLDAFGISKEWIEETERKLAKIKNRK